MRGGTPAERNSDEHLVRSVPHGTGEHVAICVCTCLRPKMLESCLRSLSVQVVPRDVQLSIIVIDNDPAGSARPVVGGYAGMAPLSVRYVHEPRRGIAIARNAALDAAFGTGADWIAFIDDDETAAPNWLEELMSPDLRAVPVLMGVQEFIDPPRRSFWAPERCKPKPWPATKSWKTAYTNNVRFSSALVHAGLRFDETLGALGGEDQQFFSTAYVLGFEIRRTPHAVTYEALHPERLTYWGQVYRAYWCATSDMRRDAVLKGWRRAILRKVHTVPFNILFGAGEIVVSPVFIAGGTLAFKRRAVSGGKKIAKGLGRAAGMLGVMPKPYARIHGG